MWKLDHKESWVPKNWCFWTVVLQKTFESSLDCKIKAVNPKGDQSWMFTGRIDAETETLIFWPPDVKSWLTAEDPDAGKDWRQEEKGVTEDEMVGWQHQLDGQEFEQALGAGDGQGGLACCSPWSHKESDTTEQLNWTTSPNPIQFNPWKQPFTGSFLSCSFFLNLSMTAQQVKSCLQRRRHRRLEFSPWVGKIPWKRNSYPLQYSSLGNPMDRETQQTLDKESGTTEPLSMSMSWCTV